MSDDPHDYEAKYRGRILTCPFCGTPPVVWGSGDGQRGLMLHCIAENCPNPSVSYYEHETTLRVWNQRAGGASKTAQAEERKCR